MRSHPRRSGRLSTLAKLTISRTKKYAQRTISAPQTALYAAAMARSFQKDLTSARTSAFLSLSAFPFSFSLGSFSISSYGFFVFLSFVVVYFVRKKEQARLNYSKDPRQRYVGVGALIGAIIGAKLGMLLFEPPEAFAQTLAKIVSLDFSGKTVVGGIAERCNDGSRGIYPTGQAPERSRDAARLGRTNRGLKATATFIQSRRDSNSPFEKMWVKTGSRSSVSA